MPQRRKVTVDFSQRLPRTLDDLKRLKVWVAWKYEPDPYKPGGFRKPPISLDGGGVGHKDRERLMTHADAVEFCKGLTLHPKVRAAFSSGKLRGSRRGVGLMSGSLGNGYSLMLLDMDDCLNSSTAAEWARPVIDRLDTHTELSPSATGLHCVGLVHDDDVPSKGNTFKRKDKPGSIELNWGRYLTVTEKVFDDQEGLRVITESDLDWLTAEGMKFAGRTASTPASSSRQWPQSREGKAINASMQKRIDQPHQQPARSTVFYNTVLALGELGWGIDQITAKLRGKPMCAGTEYGRPRIESVGRILNESCIIIPGTVVRKVPDGWKFDPNEVPPDIEWMIEHYLPRGEVMMLDGDPGVGKTSFVLLMIYCLLLGQSVLGLKVSKRRRKVLYISMEADHLKVSLPLLKAMGINEQVGFEHMRCVVRTIG